MRKINPKFLLAIIGIASIISHFIWIHYPDRPAFDEVYFATFAAKNIQGEPHLELHPPLGPLLYSAAIAPFVEPPFRDTEFIKITQNSTTGQMVPELIDIGYHDFPYIPGRAMSAVFGILLIFAFYAFLRAIGCGEWGALLGAFLVAFQNAFVIETRLMLLNGFYLTLGIASLALFFKRKPMIIAGGILFGLALSAKWVSVLLVGPMLAAFLLASREEKKELRKKMILFFGMSFVAYLAILVGNNLLFHPQDRFEFWGSYQLPGASSYVVEDHSRAAAYLTAAFFETEVSFSNYVGASSTPLDPLRSAWYEWPFMREPISYYVDPESGNQLMLIGNPVVWSGATLAAFGALIFLLGYGWRKKSHFEETFRPLYLLLAGYAFSFVPFMTVVDRSAYLYHYFPALLFSTGILAWSLERLVLSKTTLLSHEARMLLFIIFILGVIFGFLLVSPYTYGFPSLF